MLEVSSPMLDMFRKLTAQVASTVSNALPAVTYLKDDLTPEVPPALKQAARTWRPVPAALEGIDTALVAASSQAFEIATDSSLSDQGKSQKIATALLAAKADVAGQTALVMTALDKILTTLRTAAYPSRPQPQDAAQEAALAGAKSDVRMILDPLDTTASLVERMVELLSRALSDGDALTAWLLASSRWPEDYITARGGVGELASSWAPRVAQTLGGDSVTPARRAYGVLSDPQRGIPVLQLLLNTSLPAIFQGITTSGQGPVRTGASTL